MILPDFKIPTKNGFCHSALSLDRSGGWVELKFSFLLLQHMCFEYIFPNKKNIKIRPKIVTPEYKITCSLSEEFFTEKFNCVKRIND